MRVLLLLPLLFLAGCQTPPNIDIPGVINATVTALDKDKDGTITNREIKDSQNDPMFWVQIGTVILSLFGLGVARNAKTATDQLYDATHTPIAPK